MGSRRTRMLRTVVAIDTSNWLAECVVHSGEVYLQVDAANAATIELRVFVDRSIVTGFVNNGTAAVTTRA